MNVMKKSVTKSDYVRNKEHLGLFEYNFMLTYDSNKMKTKIFEVQTHSPVEKIPFAKTVKRRQLSYRNDSLFYFESEYQLSCFPIKIRSINKVRSKVEVVTYARSIGL